MSILHPVTGSILKPILSPIFLTSGGGESVNLLDGLVGWWTLNETSGNRFDSHGSQTMIAVNTPGYTTGKQGNAMACLNANAENIYSSLHFTLYPDFTTNGLSMGGWIRPSVWSSSNGYFGLDSGSSVFKVTQAYAQGDARALFYDSTRTYEQIDTYPVEPLTLNTWSHVMFIANPADGGSISLVVDGVWYTETATTDGKAVPQSGNLLYIGRTNNTQAPSCDYDEFCLYNRALGAAEIAALINGGAGLAYGDL